MCGSTEVHWYQNGWLVVVIIVVGGWLALELFNPKQGRVDVRVSGRVPVVVISSGSFELSVWHQNPGNLRNGTLTVWVRGEAVPSDEQSQIHSFETWPPNKDNAVNFSFPLKDYDPKDPLVVDYVVSPANRRDARRQMVWQDGGWKE